MTDYVSTAAKAVLRTDRSRHTHRTPQAREFPTGPPEKRESVRKPPAADVSDDAAGFRAQASRPPRFAAKKRPLLGGSSCAKPPTWGGGFRTTRSLRPAAFLVDRITGNAAASKILSTVIVS